VRLYTGKNALVCVCFVRVIVRMRVRGFTRMLYKFFIHRKAINKV